MGTIYKEINEVELKNIPLITLLKDKIKISGVKRHSDNSVNKLVYVTIYSYYRQAIIARTVTNSAGYYEFIFDKKNLSIGKYEVRYDGTGHRPALKPYGDWDVIDITKEMLQSGISSVTTIIGVTNLKAYSNDGEKTGNIDGEKIYTNTIQLVWDDFRIMPPDIFPLTVQDYQGNNVILTYQQALTIENYVVFIFVNDVKGYPPYNYPIDNVSPSRWFIATKTNLNEANIFLPDKKYFAFWVGGYTNENIFTEEQLKGTMPMQNYQRKIY